MNQPSAKQKKAPSRKITLYSFVQSLYLSISLFFSNDLISSASACAFGFMLSVIPTIMLICIVLIRVLHASPETLSALISGSPFSGQIFNGSYFASLLDSVHRITNFEIVISVAIIWMARRFFSSVVIALQRIFGGEVQPRPLRNQLIIFAGEILIVAFLSAIIFLSMTAHTIGLFPRFYGFLEPLNRAAELIARAAAVSVPFVLIFISCAFAYKFASRTKPPFSSSLIASAGTTVSFRLLTALFYLFINSNRYSMVYGVLSSVIVFLMGALFFFIIFLFFAQWLYVCQFFDTLLLCELYLLPQQKSRKSLSNIKRFLFLSPDFLTPKKGNTLCLKAGDYVYKKHEESACAFYIASGTVALQSGSSKTVLEQGTFFGEEQCILKMSRLEDAVSASDSLIVTIPYAEFRKLIERSPKVAGKAFSKIELQAERKQS